ncbi:MAG: YceI family protein [Steroidobacteraceae bacterium]
MDQRYTCQQLRHVMLCLIGVWLLSGCAAVVKQPSLITVSTSVDVAAFPTDLRGAQLYQIDTEQSQLRILVHRAGTMAHLGHNHVMSSSTLSGYVWLHPSLIQRSGFDLRLPVNDFIVDSPEARSAEGEEFPLNVTDAARAATKTNMLKPEGLDGKHYPQVRLRSVTINGGRTMPEVTFDLTIKDKARRMTIPVQLSVAAQQLRAKGEFVIKQSEFGMKPMSVMLGALQVQDLITIKFDLVALPLN